MPRIGVLELQLMNYPNVRETEELRERFQRDCGPALSGHFPTWQIPQEVVFLTELPKVKTGKIALRTAMQPTP